MYGLELELRFFTSLSHLALHTFVPAVHGLGFT